MGSLQHTPRKDNWYSINFKIQVNLELSQKIVFWKCHLQLGLKSFKLRKAHSGVVSESSGSPFHEVFRPPLSGKIPIPIMVYLPDGIKFAKMLRVFESGTAAKSPPSRKQCSLPSVQVV